MLPYSTSLGVAEAVSASHLCSSGSVAMDISSVVSEAQETVNLSSGLLSHEVASQDISQVSKRGGNSQSDPAKPEKEVVFIFYYQVYAMFCKISKYLFYFQAMPVLSGIELHDDIFSESTDIAGKK